MQLILVTIILVAVLSFLLPWASKKMAEPFQGRETFTSPSCPPPPPGVGEPTPAPPDMTLTDEFKALVKRGQERYNRLADTLTPDAVPFPTRMATATGLNTLNADIRKALETGEFIPTAIRNRLPASTFTLNKAPAPNDTIVDSITFSGPIPMDARHNLSGLGRTTSYVEERIPARDANYDKALNCQATNNNPTPPGGASVRLYRTDLCSKLAPTDTSLDAECGVCIKGTEPYKRNPASFNWGAIPFFGGLFASAKDKARTPARPTIGQCAPGFFFVKGQQDACLAAARRLNCDEYGTNGETAEKLSENRALQCMACPRGALTDLTLSSGIPYIYHDATDNTGPLVNGFRPFKATAIRLRFAVPSGTGRTHIYIMHIPNNGAQGSVINIGQPIELGLTQNQKTEFSYDLATILPRIAPKDRIKFFVYQEFPHRPRGPSEVFFVSQAGGFTAEAAATFATSIDCLVATEAQLKSPETTGLQVCDVGWASGASGQMVRMTKISTPLINRESTSANRCVLNAPAGGAIVGGPSPNTVPGVWCYGIKPKLAFVTNPTTVPSSLNPTTTIFTTAVAPFYTYYTQTNDAQVTAGDKLTRAFQNGDDNGAPNYRGIAVQIEMNESGASADTVNRRRESAELFMTGVYSNDLDNATFTNFYNSNTMAMEKTLDARLYSTANPTGIYRRAGTFSTSSQIDAPKPSTASKMIENAYWIWGRDHESNKFVFEVEVPGYFRDPQTAEDNVKCNRGPMLVDRKFINMMMSSACNAGPNSLDCISEIFRRVGGNLARGTWSPQHPQNGPENIRRLYYADYPDLSSPRTVSEIEAFLQTYADRAQKARGFSEDANTPELRRREMNEASRYLYGSDAISPCERIVETTNDQGQSVFVVTSMAAPFSADCLDFMYRRTTGEATASMPGATYNDIRMRYSGIAPNEPAADSLRTDFPYQTCQASGSWAPIGQDGKVNTVAVTEINRAIADICNAPSSSGCVEGPNSTSRSVFKAAAVFNNIYQNSYGGAGITENQQATALERCYGIRKKTNPVRCTGLNVSQIRIFNAAGAAFPITKVQDSQGATQTTPTVLSTPGSITSTYSVPNNEIAMVQFNRGSSMDLVVVQLLGGTPAEIIAQKVLPATTNTAEFTPDDVNSLVTYSNVFDVTKSEKRTGLNKSFRFESGFRAGEFLTMGPNNAPALFDYGAGASAAAFQASNFILEEVKDAIQVGSNPIYSIRIRGTANTYLGIQGLAPAFITVGTAPVQTSWGIRPAPNGASGYIGIESANFAGQYLVVLANGALGLQTLTGPAGAATEFAKVTACWRLHSATAEL